LSNSNVDAVELSGLISGRVVEGSLLVDNGINGDSGFSGLSVSNDELSLASSNWDLFVEVSEKSLSLIIINIGKDPTPTSDRRIFKVNLGLTKESTDFKPVCIGSCTDFLGMIPGAFNSILCL